MWLECLDSVMNFKCQVQKLSKDGFGRTTVTTTTTSDCFCYFGSEERRTEGNQRTQTYEWIVLLPASMIGKAAVNDRICNLVDASNVTLISSATIDKLEPVAHWGEGLQFLVLRLNKQ